MNNPLATTPKIQSCHVYVKKIAVAMCASVYEEAAKDNGFYKTHPDMKTFYTKYWPLYVAPAREQLVKMLAMDDVTDHMKEEIFDVIIKDRSLQNLEAPGV